MPSHALGCESSFPAPRSPRARVTPDVGRWAPDVPWRQDASPQTTSPLTLNYESRTSDSRPQTAKIESKLSKPDPARGPSPGRSCGVRSWDHSILCRGPLLALPLLSGRHPERKRDQPLIQPGRPLLHSPFLSTSISPARGFVRPRSRLPGGDSRASANPWEAPPARPGLFSLCLRPFPCSIQTNRKEACDGGSSSGGTRGCHDEGPWC